MSTNLEYRERERQRKRQNRAKLNEKKSYSEREKTKKTVFVGGTTWNFVAALRKWEMLAATRMKMSDSEKKSEKEHVRHFLYKTHNQEVSRSFTLKACKTTAKKWTKKVCCTCKVAFLLIRPIVVFSPFSLCLYTEPGLGPGLLARTRRKTRQFFTSPHHQ